MKKSLMVVVCVVMAFVLLAGCAAPAATQQTGTDEGTASDAVAEESTSAQSVSGGGKRIANIVAEYNESIKNG